MTVREEAEGVLDAGTEYGFAPAADWRDEGAHLTLLLDIPGVEASTLELQEDGDQLTISGQRRAEEAGRPLLSERRTGPFTRTLQFPEAVRAGSGEASLHAGVLRVRFDKLHPTIDALYREVDE